MDLGIAPTAKLTVVYVVVLFYMVTKQSNVTNVKCGFTINAPLSQNLNLILLKTQTAPGFVQNVIFFNFSDSFFTDQLNLENENRFDQLAYGSGTKDSQTGSDKNKFITGLKFVSININSIRGKKLELLAFLDFHQPQIVAIQETKIDSSISTSELFPESCPYNVYRKDRTLDGGGVMLLIHKDISHMPITELEND